MLADIFLKDTAKNGAKLLNLVSLKCGHSLKFSTHRLLTCGFYRLVLSKEKSADNAWLGGEFSENYNGKLLIIRSH